MKTLCHPPLRGTLAMVAVVAAAAAATLAGCGGDDDNLLSIPGP